MARARSTEEKKMEQIAALLNRAEDDNTTAEERELAARQAERIGAKYSIDFAVARMHTKNKHQRDDEIVTRTITIPFKSGNTRDQGWIALMLELAYANAIYIVWKSNVITLYGPKFDVEFAVSLFHILVADQERTALEHAKEQRKAGTKKSSQSIKDSFRYGYRKRVRQRIETLRDERMVEIDHEEGLQAGATALALRDRNDEMLSQFSDAVERENVQRKDHEHFRVRDMDASARREGDKAGTVVKLLADTAIDRGKKEID